MIVMFMEKKKNYYCFPGYIFIFNIFSISRLGTYQVTQFAYLLGICKTLGMIHPKTI